MTFTRQQFKDACRQRGYGPHAAGSALDTAARLIRARRPDALPETKDGPFLYWPFRELTSDARNALPLLGNRDRSTVAYTLLIQVIPDLPELLGWNIREESGQRP